MASDPARRPFIAHHPFYSLFAVVVTLHRGRDLYQECRLSGEYTWTEQKHPRPLCSPLSTQTFNLHPHTLSLILHQGQLTALIDSMPFRGFCKFWALTSAFLPNGDIAAPVPAFETLVGLFEAWSARLTPPSGIHKVLRIARATEQLTDVLGASSEGGQDTGFAQLDELEEKTSAAESAAQRFRRAREAIAEAVSQTLETGGDALPPGLVLVRDAAFGELQEALQQLEICVARVDLPAV